MRDPHVTSLTYVAVSSPTDSFDRAQPIQGKIDSLQFTLEHGLLLITPSTHFPSVEKAREFVDPLLEAWQIDIYLRYGEQVLSFAYETGDLIDRNPPPPGSPKIVEIGMAIESDSALSITPLVARARHPEPPVHFRATPTTLTLWHRYQGYKQGREPLPAMAYFCLTVLESSAGSRKDASFAFKISRNVLDRIGELTTERGDRLSARKYGAVASGRPLAGNEVRWLEEVVKAIIRRMGELHALDTLPQIDMLSLPQL